MNQYIVCDDGGHWQTIFADSPNEAIQNAKLQKPACVIEYVFNALDEEEC